MILLPFNGLKIIIDVKFHIVNKIIVSILPARDICEYDLEIIFREES